METDENLLATIRERASQRILFSQHGVRQMSRPDRMISITDIRMVLEKGEVIEDYLEDPRGHSCLILGKGTGGRPVHVLCSPKDDYLAIITAYLPTEEEWTSDFRVRKKP
ncbi:MAG: DUF4258 domain-containing protein [Desulfobacterales bacterium]|nr:DUF4258 domain-containing protein [Desulfobacterales bacterium]